jgi:uncharacterized membrane protein YgcG
MKKVISAVLLILCNLLYSQAPIPAIPSKGVLNIGNLLTADQEALLENKISLFQKNTGWDLKVVVVSDVRPYSTASDYAKKLFKSWNYADEGETSIVIVVAQQIGASSSNMKD